MNNSSQLLLSLKSSLEVPASHSDLHACAYLWLCHLHVIGKCVHQQPVLDELLPLGLLHLQVAVVVVGHDDAVRVVSQLDYVAVVIAHDPFAINTARRRVHQDVPLLQLPEDVLV